MDDIQSGITLYQILYVFIIGLLPVIGGLAQSFINLKKEERQWEREQKAKEKEWLRDNKKEELEEIREYFQNAHSALSTFITFESQNDEKQRESRDQQIEEINNWISKIATRYFSDDDLRNKISDFNSFPEKELAFELRKKLIELSKRESGFYLDEPGEETSSSQDSKNGVVRTLTFDIDTDFRKQKWIEGKEVEPHYERDFKINDLTKSQREKIVKMYFGNTLSKKFPLRLPSYNESKDEVVFNQEKWKAKINPEENDLQTIISNWEKDYEKDLERAKEKIKS